MRSIHEYVVENYIYNVHECRVKTEGENIFSEGEELLVCSRNDIIFLQDTDGKEYHTIEDLQGAGYAEGQITFIVEW